MDELNSMDVDEPLTTSTTEGQQFHDGNGSKSEVSLATIPQLRSLKFITEIIFDLIWKVLLFHSVV